MLYIDKDMIGRVYKIIHLQSNICYVGSTFNILRQRWQSHKNAFNGFLKNKNRGASIYQYFEKYGIENFKLILIREYEVVDRYHLEAYETLWINKLKSCNKYQPFRITYLYNKKWGYENRNQRNLYKKEYRKNNQELIKIQKKEYYEKNKENIKIKKSEWKNKNKDKLSEKVMCECGSLISKRHKKEHEKTQKHKKNIV